ncbi:MAG: hypothetical protein KGL36_03020 [Gammaproteobacteria bacterium]|nr:hypothetical protein [Gammaproteobacteria bacterium]
MKAADLSKVWAGPDNSRLTAKQQSFRLPTHVAAKINALCDLYPHRTKTEIVGDLLASALEEAVKHLPAALGEEWGRDSNSGEMLYHAAGRAAEFRRLANKHYKAIEKELGNKEAGELYSDALLVSKADVEEQS